MSDRDRRDPRHRPQRPAQGGRPLHPRPGQLHRRHAPARHAAHGDPAQPVRARHASTAIDTSQAQALPGVVAVVTGELMAQHNLAWMPTLSGDTQAVLATDKVRFQGQEVAAVIADGPLHRQGRARADRRRLRPARRRGHARSRRSQRGAPVIRDDKEGQTDNHIYHWEAGDKEATDAAFAEADKVVTLDTHYPRSPPGAARDVRHASPTSTRPPARRRST